MRSLAPGAPCEDEDLPYVFRSLEGERKSRRHLTSLLVGAEVPEMSAFPRTLGVLRVLGAKFSHFSVSAFQHFVISDSPPLSALKTVSRKDR
jgi:hypothetical protein